MSRRLLPAALLVIAAPLASGRPAMLAVTQPSTLTVRVEEEATRRPLPNAEILDLASGAHRFTNEYGEARIVWPVGGSVRLRVPAARIPARRAGRRALERGHRRFHYGCADAGSVRPSQSRDDRDRSVRRGAGLARQAAFDSSARAPAHRRRTLRGVSTRVSIPHSPGASHITLGTDGKPRIVRRVEELARSEEWGEPYRPGRLIHRSGSGFSIPLLFLGALADPRFWERHCFVVRGVEPYAGRRVLRLEFTPARGVRRAEWVGAAFTDSATSLLHRVEFRLVGLRPDDVPARLEGYTTFSSPSPFITMPESTVAMWWRRAVPADSAWEMPDVVQLLRRIDVEYRRARPPG